MLIDKFDDTEHIPTTIAVHTANHVNIYMGGRASSIVQLDEEKTLRLISALQTALAKLKATK